VSADKSDISRWTDATLAAALFAVDPAGVVGVSLRAHAGPVRDRWLAMLRAWLPDAVPLRRLPLHITDGRLLGGLDLAATLRVGKPVAERGILVDADGGVLVIAMAERLESSTAARLGATLDSGEVVLERDGIALRTPTRLGVVALDEGIAEDERPPAALLDRLSFHLDLAPISIKDAAPPLFGPEEVAAARALMPSVRIGDKFLEALCGASLALGIDSIRAPLLALRVARAAAALAGRSEVTDEDAAAAARLVFSPRATVLPAPEEEEQEQEAPPPEPPPDTPPDEDKDEATNLDKPLSDLVLAAAAAAIPDDLLARLRLAGGGVSRIRSSGKAGELKHSARRGRPIGTRRGELRQGARLNVVETLRAAAPWQPLRRRERGEARAKEDAEAALASAGHAHPAPPGKSSAKAHPSEPQAKSARSLAKKDHIPTRVEVRRDDFRIMRFKQRTETTTIFAVDASGSSALHRLAEAKGAVELLLADCYVRRDRVALLAFRGQTAELLLPPTNSLVRAKRSLAGLPGGGGTPLASGIDAAVSLADVVRRKGQTPILILMTDGKGNIARDGTPGRPRAEEEALAAARLVRATRLTALLVDTSPRPNQAAQRLANEMNAHYLPLPYADAASLSRAVRAAVAQPGKGT
jgi:magnesium chelatase subunit D